MIPFSRIHIRALLETWLVNLYAYLYKRTLKDAFDTANIFFIVSLGRSGTQFLSNLLNLDPSTNVFHEPIRRDILEYVASFKDSYDPAQYIKGFRKKYLQYQVTNQPHKVYGEVNSFLRRHSAAIVNNIPNVKVLFVIRDGRKVVRSMLNRGTFSDNWYYKSIIPGIDSPYKADWEQWGQFEKCCWHWASDNKILFDRFGRGINFETLLEDYDYLKEKILDPLQLDVTEGVWQVERLVKSDNRTRQFTVPAYRDWSPAWIKSFGEICGEMMEIHGYQV
jgi:hypothetical protein